MKNFLIGCLALMITVASIRYFYWQDTSSCLAENEIAEFKVDDGFSLATSTVTIFVKDKNSGEVQRQFTEPILQAGHYHPVELHKCGAYFLQGENMNIKDPTNNPVGFVSRLFKFDYSGEKLSIVTTAERPKEHLLYFNRDFRVDSLEKYVALESLTNLKDRYLVIRSLTTGQELFKLRGTEIESQNSSLVGDMMFLDWTRDGRYFWANLFEAAYVNGWVRVDSKDWSYELHEAPEGVLGGYPLNIETGWVPVIPGAFWTGVVELDDEVKQERSASGESADLYLYNVITKTRVLVEDTNAPIWRGLKAQWLSDSELEYTMPDGTKKIYSVD